MTRAEADGPFCGVAMNRVITPPAAMVKRVPIPEAQARFRAVSIIVKSEMQAYWGPTFRQNPGASDGLKGILLGEAKSGFSKNSTM